jgi:hypothetical protein
LRGSGHLCRNRCTSSSRDPPEQKTRKGVFSTTVSGFGGPATLFHQIELPIKSPHHEALRSKRALKTRIVLLPQMGGLSNMPNDSGAGDEMKVLRAIDIL